MYHYDPRATGGYAASQLRAAPVHPSHIQHASPGRLVDSSARSITPSRRVSPGRRRAEQSPPVSPPPHQTYAAAYAAPPASLLQQAEAQAQSAWGRDVFAQHPSAAPPQQQAGWLGQEVQPRSPPQRRLRTPPMSPRGHASPEAAWGASRARRTEDYSAAQAAAAVLVRGYGAPRRGATAMEARQEAERLLYQHLSGAQMKAACASYLVSEKNRKRSAAGKKEKIDRSAVPLFLKRGVKGPSAIKAKSKGIVKASGRLERSAAVFKKAIIQANPRAHGGEWESDPRAAQAQEQCYGEADPAKWKFVENDGCNVSLTTTNDVEPIEVGSKDDAIAMLKESPEMYYACDWKKGRYIGKPRVYPRECNFYKEGFSKSSQPDATACMIAKYEALPAKVSIRKDNYTDSILAEFQGCDYSTSKSPGRGQGLSDGPGLKIIGDVDPNDVKQGSIGDCWLLSAISALAEFDGAVHALFKNNSDLSNMPADGPNVYTVTLWDLPTWSEVDVQVDERLVWGDSSLLGAKPSDDNELWVCYLEKAVAAHCGGWDKIDGGCCTHAWRLLTGCREVYTIQERDGLYGSNGLWNPNDDCWDECGNSPHDGPGGIWPMAWPEVGGGGDLHLKIDADELFERMCAWDDRCYIMGAGTKSGSDTEKTDGIVDGHAYTVISCIDNAGGSQYDMILVRNPWGSGEFECGGWQEGGPLWKKYPKVFEACGEPVEADDGLFWIQKEDFFKYFKTIYLCAKDMSEFQ